MKYEFESNIKCIRAIEDCIRATSKYTEYVRNSLNNHPIQGASHPSRVVTKHYEVTPEIEINWDMPVGHLGDWLMGETTIIDVTFNYNYNVNKGKLTILNGNNAMESLCSGIPGFEILMNRVRVEN